MDRTYSASEVARLLGTNVPRVVRTAERLGLEIRRPRHSRGARLALKHEHVERLRQELGSGAPAAPLSRVETQALAALARSPRGVISARSLARRAGISPTAGARALSRLVERGLVRKERAQAALGRAREVDVYRADVRAPEWARLAPHVAHVRSPRATRRGPQRSRRVPPELAHLFWNTSPSQLDLDSAGRYIARRLIQTGDLDGLAWGAERLRREDWLHAAKTRGLAPDLRALALNLAKATS